MRGGEEVSRQAHNLKNGGASPSPATKNKINIIYMAGNTSLNQNMTPTTGGGYVEPPTTDPDSNKCLTEWELGKKSCWAWGARKASLSKTYCPTKSEMLSAEYNTIYATSTLNDGTAESNYNIFGNPGGDDKKLVRRGLLATAARVQFVINVVHNLSLKPDDYTIQAFLCNSTNSTTNACNIGTITVGLGKGDWHDYVLKPLPKNLLYSSDDTINRDAYICLTIGNSSWKNTRDFYITTLYWTGSAWENKTSRQIVGDGKKTVTFNTGIKWREMIGNRYRFKFELVKN